MLEFIVFYVKEESEDASEIVGFPNRGLLELRNELGSLMVVKVAASQDKGLLLLLNKENCWHKYSPRVRDVEGSLLIYNRNDMIIF